MDYNNPWNSPGQNTGVGSHSLPYGIFPTQGSNPVLPHCGWIPHQLSYQGSPVVRFKSAVFTDSTGLGCFNLQVFRLFWAGSSVKSLRGEVFSSREQLVPDPFCTPFPFESGVGLVINDFFKKSDKIHTQSTFNHLYMHF